MLNKVILMGRITHDLELKTTLSGVAVISFSVAVERSYAAKGDQRQTDFVNCVAWRQTAIFISKYFAKGRMIAITGSLRSRSYEDKNGVTHYVTEVYVDEVSFTGEPKKEEVAVQAEKSQVKSQVKSIGDSHDKHYEKTAMPLVENDYSIKEDDLPF